MFNKHWFRGATRLIDKQPQDRLGEMDPGLLAIAEEGRGYTIDDYMDAMDARVDLGRRMNLFHESYDLLITPTLAVPAFDVG
ncbi:MAG: hypothetical protein HOA30_13305 [Rhodospirillaceae bacterium]|nr:hypothetical protein [Rhodospirillaceae bacterium]